MFSVHAQRLRGEARAHQHGRVSEGLRCGTGIVFPCNALARTGARIRAYRFTRQPLKSAGHQIFAPKNIFRVRKGKTLALD